MIARSGRKDRRTTTIPVTTMEEIPLLDGDERTELLASLQQSEADISAGKGTVYESESFKERLLRIFRGEKP